MIKAIGFDYVGVVAQPETGGLRLDFRLLQLAEQLRDANYRIGLMSNLGVGWASRLSAQGLEKFFEATVLLGDTAYVKPDGQAFVLLAQHLNVATRELVYIDDSPASLVAVEKLGVIPILYQGYDQLVVDLTSHGISWH